METVTRMPIYDYIMPYRITMNFVSDYLFSKAEPGFPF